jgi:hypothetical protein
VRSESASRAQRSARHDHGVESGDLAQLAREINARCRLRGTFTLRSGQVSDEYFDKYLFETDPQLLARVTGAMQALLPEGTELPPGPCGTWARSSLPWCAPSTDPALAPAVCRPRASRSGRC